MSGDENARLIYGLLFAILLISSLAARRLPLKQTAKMLLAWVAIFAAFFTLFLFRNDFSEIWNRAKADFSGNSEIAADGSLKIKKDGGGHFVVRAKVNDVDVDFLVDTGATTTTLNADDAKRANVEIDMSGFPVVVHTANGIATDRRARAATLDVGPIARKDFPIHVSAGLGDTNVLGMNFLSSLKGWRVEGDELVLNP